MLPRLGVLHFTLAMVFVPFGAPQAETVAAPVPATAVVRAVGAAPTPAAALALFASLGRGPLFARRARADLATRDSGVVSFRVADVAVLLAERPTRTRRTPKPWGPHPEWAGSSIGRAADS